MSDLDAFNKRLATVLDAAYADSPGQRPLITYTTGPRYIRIVKSDGPASRSVYGFIDWRTGDLFKAESWTKVAKGRRGNWADAELPCLGRYSLR